MKHGITTRRNYYSSGITQLSVCGWQCALSILLVLLYLPSRTSREAFITIASLHFTAIGGILALLVTGQGVTLTRAIPRLGALVYQGSLGGSMVFRH